MSARVAKNAPPTVPSAARCCVSWCHEPTLLPCPWRLHSVDLEGVKHFTGKTCGLNLCANHGMRAGKTLLCPWHHKLANEQSLLPAMPPAVAKDAS